MRFATEMVKVSIQVFLLSVIVSLTACSEHKASIVIGGEIDLKDWSGKSLHLDGEWLFYWGQYNGNTLAATPDVDLIMVPSMWNNLADSLQWKAFGKGVYRLNLKNIPDRQLALRMSSRVFSSYRLLVDEIEVSRVGQTGFDEPYQADMMIQMIPLPTGKDNMTLTIEVANYSQRRGGILMAPRIGLLEDMIAESRLRLLPELVAITIILAISFIGFNLYILDGSKKLHLYLGILAVASVLRQITIGEVLYKLLWPGGPNAVFEILRHGALLVSLAVSARFLRVLFGKTINKNLLIGMECLYYVLGILILLTPSWLNSYWSFVAQPVALWMMIYAIYLGVRHRKKFPRVEWLVVGALAVIFVFLHDVLIASLVLRGAYLQSYGMSFFIVCYAVYVNKTSQSIQNRHSALARQLTELSVISNKKRELDVEVADTLKQLRPILDQYDQKKTQELIQGINQHHTISDRQTVLQQTLIESNEQFLDNLHRRFPDLTRSEEEVCLLLRAKLSTKEIAQVRKITVESAKVARKRLRKKLKLEPDQDIYQFLSSI